MNTEENSGSRYLSMDEAAEALLVSRRTLERMVAAGDFPSPMKVGNSNRYTWQDIEDYTNRCREERDKLDRMRSGSD